MDAAFFDSAVENSTYLMINKANNKFYQYLSSVSWAISSSYAGVDGGGTVVVLDADDGIHLAASANSGFTGILNGEKEEWIVKGGKGKGSQGGQGADDQDGGQDGGQNSLMSNTYERRL